MDALLSMQGVLAAAAYAGTKAGQLDGVDEYLLGPSYQLSAASGFSITCWAQHNQGAGTFGRIFDQISSGVNININIEGSPAWLKAVWDAGDATATTAAVTLTVNTWYHLGFTFANVAGTITVKIYRNGVEQVSASATPTSVGTPTGAFNIGQRNNVTQRFNGKVADFAVWDAAVLVGTDMVALYNSGARKDPRACGVGAPTYLWAFTEDDDMTGTTGSVEDLMGGTALTPYNTESGDLVAGP